MSESINFIKQEVNPEIKKVHYFSDGCAGQYKNKKHFLNLCFHKIDFNVDCVWNFLPQVMASHLVMALVAQSKD